MFRQRRHGVDILDNAHTAAVVSRHFGDQESGRMRYSINVAHQCREGLYREAGSLVVGAEERPWWLTLINDFSGTGATRAEFSGRSFKP